MKKVLKVGDEFPVPLFFTEDGVNDRGVRQFYLATKNGDPIARVYPLDIELAIGVKVDRTS